MFSRIAIASLFLCLAHGQADDYREPLIRVNVVARSTKAVNYQHRSGPTNIEFRGTAIVPKSLGRAKVESKQGRIEVDASFSDLPPAYSIGPEYITYVLWAITPEGRAKNLGELLLNGQKSRINVTTDFQVFGLIVTAEPYFAVTQPSDVIALENEIRPDTRGRWDIVDAKYDLLQRGQYAGSGSAQPMTWSPKIPIELVEARNAVRIARHFRADQFAPDIFEKAEKALAFAEDYQDRQSGWKSVTMMARESVQRSEDARLVSVKRQQEERLAAEKRQAAEREARAKEIAAQETRLRERAESDRAAAETARREAEATARRTAEQLEATAKALAEAEKARKEAETARAEAVAAQRALTAEVERTKKSMEVRMVRESLTDSLGFRDSSQGFAATMGDNLFDAEGLTGEAKKRLSRLAGIGQNWQALQFEMESCGSAKGRLVRQHLLDSGLKENRLLCKETGDSQAERPVEIILKGEGIEGGDVKIH